MFRGINLDKRQLKSATLKAVVEQLGFTDVKTLLASGNVVFTAPGEEPDALADKLRAALKSETGIDSEVFVRTSAQMAAVVKANPFADAARDRPSFLVVTFFRNDVPSAPLDRIAKTYDGPETLVASGRELFIDFPNGQGRSQLGPAMAKAGFPEHGTARNWNTVCKIAGAL